MSVDEDIGFPGGSDDERELLLSWLGYLRGAVLRKLAGISDDQARWRPEGALISLLGIVNHLTHVEWRWIDGGILGRSTERMDSEFEPGPELTLSGAKAAYEQRGAATDAVIRAAASLSTPCSMRLGTDLRWVVLHLINETARHAGHADAVRELLDGSIGE
ncbi:DinB family protein [Arthrobacter sp. H35-D1]|uniref:DinB family protein n=1 Tax=Arthrobacter sp. H35-D1 TaxID=3046202 RepID=UPI0024B8DDE0|nr:DinB family protein [Arthrobacter sp. H35-D1]MDJ0313127.1 DinB family protein [Arthrobacter sp. H35-D1]